MREIEKHQIQDLLNHDLLLMMEKNEIVNLDVSNFYLFLQNHLTLNVSELIYLS